MTTITRTQGDTYADELTILSRSTGLPVLLTGYTLQLIVSSSLDSDDVSARKYVLAGVILNAAAGRVEFAPTALQADLVGTFFYQFKMVDGVGRKRTLQKGKYIYEE